MLLTLNWKEIESLCKAISPQIQGSYFERLVVPSRPQYPLGFLKGEWAIELSSRKRQDFLVISIRTQAAYLALYPKKAFKVAPKGTRSAFDLELSKHLEGLKISEIQATRRDRALTIWFTTERKNSRLGIFALLIPAQPEAFLIEENLKSELGFKILSGSRRAEFKALENKNAPEAPLVRTEIEAGFESFSRAVETELEARAFAERFKLLQKARGKIQKKLLERYSSAERARAESEREPDFKLWGTLLKATLPDAPPCDAQGLRRVIDYNTGEALEIRCNPELTASEQVQKFFHQAKRKERRSSEANSRLTEAQIKLKKLEKLFETDPVNWTDLKLIEGEVLPSAESAKSAPQGSTKTGKCYLSKDRFRIWVGRSSAENLELTFKLARGNDVWLHVKGKPGAHVVVQIPSNKSAPLETLLDAATLAIYFSKGEHWGKTEVDYTFKKYVKRIKDSTEASYTGNKTLVLELDRARLARLQAAEVI